MSVFLNHNWQAHQSIPLMASLYQRNGLKKVVILIRAESVLIHLYSKYRQLFQTSKNRKATQMDIKPFRINIPQAAMDDLQYRLAHTQYPDQLPGADWSRGVPVGYMKSLAEYWGSGFDWRSQEAQLNAFPQFMTEIDGQPIHFLHMRSQEPNAKPLLLLHGYPSSVVEFMKIIDPLTNPRAYGGNPSDAFHVVAPSLPGFGFSMPVKESGWDLVRTSKAIIELMKELGYERYFAHGGDVGAGIVGMLGSYDGEHMMGGHVVTDPTSIALLGAPIDDPDANPNLSDGEKARMRDLRELQAEGKGYLQIQSTKPQTLAYGLADSPVGQLAWIVEKVQAWTNVGAELPEQAVDRDQLLTNISLYWFTRTGATAANFIYEAFHSSAPWAAGSQVPTGFAAFNIKNVEKAMRDMVDPQRAIAHWSEFVEGGHFPAMEVPDLLVNDIRAFFRSLG
jgi:pimeloyl-ACP methyl ester carboxylesterase